MVVDIRPDIAFFLVMTLLAVVVLLIVFHAHHGIHHFGEFFHRQHAVVILVKDAHVDSHHHLQADVVIHLLHDVLKFFEFGKVKQSVTISIGFVEEVLEHRRFDFMLDVIVVVTVLGGFVVVVSFV